MLGHVAEGLSNTAAVSFYAAEVLTIAASDFHLHAVGLRHDAGEPIDHSIGLFMSAGVLFTTAKDLGSSAKASMFNCKSFVLHCRSFNHVCTRSRF